MAYVKTVWENLPSTNTPINASNLNKIEDQLEENTDDIAKIYGTVLYQEENSPVGTGTIDLNDNISNYRKVDITFINNDNEACGVTIYNPSGKKICMKSSHAGGATYYYVDYSAYITLSGTTGTYSDGRYLTVNNQKTIFEVSACKTQKITSIIGYK